MYGCVPRGGRWPWSGFGRRLLPGSPSIVYHVSAVIAEQMTTRERLQAVLSFESFDRLPIVEWASWWDDTISRWHGEGLPARLTDRYEICEYFGLDVWRQFWIPARSEQCPRPASHGAPVISSMDEYERIRHLLFPPFSLDRAWWQAIRQQSEGRAVLWFTLDGFFWFPRTLLGIERHLYAFYDQLELMHRINRDLAEWQISVIEEITRVCVPDFMTFAEDMSYNHGPMLSKQLFDAFLRPYYDLVIPRLKEKGIYAIVDSDGDIAEPAPWFEEAGLDGILPLERQAGVDVPSLQERHPRMKFIGHFDKMTMNKGETRMRQEFERLLPAATHGGFVMACDHQTPPGVSLSDYRCYLRLFAEYAHRAQFAGR